MPPRQGYSLPTDSHRPDAAGGHLPARGPARPGGDFPAALPVAEKLETSAAEEPPAIVFVKAAISAKPALAAVIVKAAILSAPNLAERIVQTAIRMVPQHSAGLGRLALLATPRQRPLTAGQRSRGRKSKPPGQEI